MSKKLTPYQEMFGDYTGPFTYADNWEKDEDIISYLGYVFYLYEDDNSNVPAFIRASKKGASWEENNQIAASWMFMMLHEITPLIINTRDELEMMIMLQPKVEEGLRDYFNEKWDEGLIK